MRDTIFIFFWNKSEILAILSRDCSDELWGRVYFIDISAATIAVTRIWKY